MKQFHTRKIVDFSPAEMFALVKDVEAYPEFVPLCAAVDVRKRRRPRDGVEILLVDMRVGLRGFRETVVSRVICDTPAREIRVENVAGPFRDMQSCWLFEDEESGADRARCAVSFSMRYELKSRMLDLLVGALLDAAFSRYTEAFVRRAQQVFGGERATRGAAA